MRMARSDAWLRVINDLVYKKHLKSVTDDFKCFFKFNSEQYLDISFLAHLAFSNFQ